MSFLYKNTKIDPKSTFWKHIARISDIENVSKDNIENILEDWHLLTIEKQEGDRICLCKKKIKYYYEAENIKNFAIINLGTTCYQKITNIELLTTNTNTINKKIIKRFSNGLYVTNFKLSEYIIDCIQLYLDKQSLEKLYSYSDIYKNNKIIYDYIEKLIKEKKEFDRLEKERIERERKELEKSEKERIENELLEKEERIKKNRQKQERLEKERIKKERQKQERLEKERIKKERQKQERLEKERIKKEMDDKDFEKFCIEFGDILKNSMTQTMNIIDKELFKNYIHKYTVMYKNLINIIETFILKNLKIYRNNMFLVEYLDKLKLIINNENDNLINIIKGVKEVDKITGYGCKSRIYPINKISINTYTKQIQTYDTYIGE